MKWAYHVQDKMKAVGVLFLIIVIILATNISNRKTFTDLDHSVASIYKDRLLPATYIFHITDHLYQKRLLLENGDLSASDKELHDKAITALIKIYESTYLTSAEKQEWSAFKQHLSVFDKLSNSLNKNDEAITVSFNNTLQSLNALSNIQANEGKHIETASKKIVSGTVITSQLQVALLLILGIMALMLVSASDNRIFQNSEKHSLN